MKNWGTPYVSVWLFSKGLKRPNIRPRSWYSCFQSFLRWSSTSIGDMYFCEVPSLYSSSLDSTSLFSLSIWVSFCCSDASMSGPDYLRLVVWAVVSFAYSFSSSPKIRRSLEFDDSLVVLPYLMFLAYLATVALRAANGLTNNFVCPSLLTAGDFFLQCGHVVVIT